MKSQQGLTLVELVVVIAIVSILISLAIPSFEGLIQRTKVRKMVDLVSQIITFAKSDALRNNRKTYVGKVGTDFCVGTTAGACDLRKDPLVSGVDVSNTSLIISPFYGIPDPAPATFTVSYSGISQSVTINMLGIVSVGAI